MGWYTIVIWSERRRYHMYLNRHKALDTLLNLPLISAHQNRHSLAYTLLLVLKSLARQE